MNVIYHTVCVALIIVGSILTIKSGGMFDSAAGIVGAVLCTLGVLFEALGITGVFGSLLARFKK